MNGSREFLYCGSALGKLIRSHFGIGTFFVAAMPLQSDQVASADDGGHDDDRAHVEYEWSRYESQQFLMSQTETSPQPELEYEWSRYESQQFLMSQTKPSPQPEPEPESTTDESMPAEDESIHISWWDEVEQRRRRIWLPEDVVEIWWDFNDKWWKFRTSHEPQMSPEDESEDDS